MWCDSWCGAGNHLLRAPIPFSAQRSMLLTDAATHRAFIARLVSCLGALDSSRGTNNRCDMYLTQGTGTRGFFLLISQ